MGLKKELLRQCLSQKELAEKTRISPATISGAVTGARNPSPKMRRKIAAALDVEPQKLFR